MYAMRFDSQSPRTSPITLYLGKSQYDIAYDKKYDTLSLNTVAGPNPEQNGVSIGKL